MKFTRLTGVDCVKGFIKDFGHVVSKTDQKKLLTLAKTFPEIKVESLEVWTITGLAVFKITDCNIFGTIEIRFVNHP